MEGFKMVPGNTILDAIVNLLAGDTATLASLTAMKVHLAKAAFTPGPGMVPGDFTEAAFTGSTALDAGTGTQTVFVDPATGLRTIQIEEPAGGWTWLCTAGTGLPETIYGYYVTDNAGAVVYGAQRFTTPITITASGQAVNISWIRFTFLAGSPT
jgi:hypothetical protein